MPLWFDAHLDLACLAVTGREMNAPLESLSGGGPHKPGPWAPASITLPSLADGGVRFALATIFTEVVPTPDEATTAEQYPAGDVERAHRTGRAQLEVYETWRDRGLVTINLPRALRVEPGVGRVRAGMGVAEVVPPSLEARMDATLRGTGERPRDADGPPLHIGILMENADPIRTPDELPWWTGRGVCAIGLAWARPSRYAMGNSAERDDSIGLTDLGRRLVRDMDALGVVHDLSHLSDRACDELLALTDKPVIASHSNCRALLDGVLGPGGGNHRLLRDETVRQIARRGGVVGINLCSAFLGRGLWETGRATIADVVAHVERICVLTGSRRHVALGSDMDGGFAATRLPEGIDRPRDLVKILDALRERGWGDEDVADFSWRNWARFWAGEATCREERP